VEGDVFSIIAQQLLRNREIPFDVILRIAQDCSLLSTAPVIINDAQVLLDMMPEKYFRSRGGEPRSLFYGFDRALLSRVVIYAGLDQRLTLATSGLDSSVGNSSSGNIV